MTASDPFRSRVLPCDEWDRLWPDLAWIVTTASKWKKDYIAIARICDTRVTPRHPRTSVADLSELHEMYPDARPQAYLQSMLGDMDQYARMRDTIDRLNSTICHKLEVAIGTEGEAVAETTASANRSRRWERRFVNPDIWGASLDQAMYDPLDRIPDLGTIFQGIYDGAYAIAQPT